MKRDATRELIVDRQVEGLKRKVSSLGRLAAKATSERDKSHKAASRYLVAFTRLSDAVELVLDELAAWGEPLTVETRLGRPEADALRNLREIYESVVSQGASDG